MRIIGIEGLTAGELNSELQRGAKFVTYQYCVSLLVVTFKRFSNVYFVRADEGNFGRMAGYTAISLLLGWWGIPWGPIYTIQSLITNFGGGKVVTQQVVNALNQSPK
jgi:hypothetical protein